MNIFKKISTYDCLALIIFAFFVTAIYLTNLHGNFWLSGWDNLHPEFNFQANISRAIYSAWQEYQGVGLPAGNAHATELFREILLWLVSPFFASQALRKLYLVFMLFLGSAGFYIFITRCLFYKTSTHFQASLGIMGGLFYLLNLATLQIFYTPFEPFSAYFGFLPWLIFSVYYYFKNRSLKSLIILILINLLASASFYVPTVFLAHLFFVTTICLGLIRKFKSGIKSAVIIIAILFITNLYWILPFGYYIANNIHSQTEAYQNIIWNKDIYFQNKKFADIGNVALLKGFLFDYVDIQRDGTFNYLMSQWKTHLESYFILMIGYSFFAVILLGFLSNIVKKKNLHFILLLILFFSLLAFNDYPFKLINDLLREIAIFDQVFRNPFTKFANLTVFLYSIFFVYGIEYIMTILVKAFKQDKPHDLAIFNLLFSLLVVTLLNFYLYPIWTGNLIYSPLKTNIPKVYFDVFEYFKNQEDGRIANLPQFVNSGWEQYRWGYIGSGFMWYGIRQPILDRAFDVWNKDNENYYWEISQSIYSQNLAQFESVIEKYRINWLMVDRDIAGADYKALYFDKLNNLLNESKKIYLAKNFGEIQIYEVLQNTQTNHFVDLTGKLPVVQPDYQANNFDKAHLEYGDFRSSRNIEANNLNVFYPIRSLFTDRRQEDLEFNLIEYNDYYSFTTEIPSFFAGSDLFIPKLDREEFTEFDKTDLTKETVKLPEISVGSQTFPLSENAFDIESNIPFSDLQSTNLEIKIPKINGYNSYNSELTGDLFNGPVKSCDRFNQGIYNSKKITQLNNQLLQLASIASSNCVTIDSSYLNQRFGYLLSITSQNNQGRSLLLHINNNSSKRTDTVTYLPQNQKLSSSYYIIAPKEYYGIGYNLVIDNISLDQSITENLLGDIKI